MIFRLGARSLAVATAVFAFLPLACADQRLGRERLSIVRADGSAVEIDCEMARTDAEQETGYMGRKRIPDGTGMLFVFRSDERLSFWMKNTPHPLSIAYLDSSGVIREIYDMTPYSLETVSSERSLRYALEVPQGWFTRARVAVGDSLSGESLALATGNASR